MAQQDDQRVPSVGGISHAVADIISGENQANQYRHRQRDGHSMPSQDACLNIKGNTDNAGA